MLFGLAIIGFRFTLSGLESKVEHQRIQVNKIQDEAREVDRIKEDIAFYKERERAIIEIKSNRILWTQKLDQLVRRTPSNIWITRINLSTLDPNEYKWEKGVEQTGGRLTLTCYAQGNEVSAITNYISSLSGQALPYRDLIDVRTLPDNFFGDFLKFSQPSWTSVDLDDFTNPTALRFVLDASLKPLFEQPNAKKKAKG